MLFNYKIFHNKKHKEPHDGFDYYFKTAVLLFIQKTDSFENKQLSDFNCPCFPILTIKLLFILNYHCLPFSLWDVQFIIPYNFHPQLNFHQ